MRSTRTPSIATLRRISSSRTVSRLRHTVGFVTAAVAAAGRGRLVEQPGVEDATCRARRPRRTPRSRPRSRSRRRSRMPRHRDGRRRPSGCGREPAHEPVARSRTRPAVYRSSWTAPTPMRSGRLDRRAATRSSRRRAIDERGCVTGGNRRLDLLERQDPGAEQHVQLLAQVGAQHLRPIGADREAHAVLDERRSRRRTSSRSRHDRVLRFDAGQISSTTHARAACPSRIGSKRALDAVTDRVGSSASTASRDLLLGPPVSPAWTVTPSPATPAARAKRSALVGKAERRDDTGRRCRPPTTPRVLPARSPWPR